MKPGAKKRKPTKRDIAAALAKLKQIENLKESISALRNQLRTVIGEVADICGSLEYSEDQIDQGLGLLRSGLEDMSAYL